MVAWISFHSFSRVQFVSTHELKSNYRKSLQTCFNSELFLKTGGPLKPPHCARKQTINPVTAIKITCFVAHLGEISSLGFGFDITVYTYIHFFFRLLNFRLYIPSAPYLRSVITLKIGKLFLFTHPVCS